ncbi:MAG: hypothetical protein ACHQ51_14775 [Elusimicrobiota bacterium]
MNRKSPASLFKSVGVGALSGALVFFALTAVKAQQSLTVNDLRANPKLYVGNTVAITGLVSGVRSEMKKINGQQVPWTKLNLYERDAKGRKGSHYVYVSLPAANFTPTPNEGDQMTVTGPLKWPYEIAAIDP